MTEIPRFLRLPQVIQLTGLAKTCIYEQAAAGTFPKPRRISATASAWREDEIRAWIESRPVVERLNG